MRSWRRRIASIGTCAMLSVALLPAPHATSADPFRIWKVGSPHRGDTPAADVPIGFTQKAATRGFELAVESFPAAGFASTFFDAVARNAAPDLIVIDNHGVIDGITTALGRFTGIGEEPAVRRDLVRVTGAFDELLGPERGWTYLFSSSANHAAAKALALRTPECSNASAATQLPESLGDIVEGAATAFLKRDLAGVQGYADPERLSGTPARFDDARVGSVRSCQLWGNNRLAFVSINASYEADAALGHVAVLLVVRKPFAQSEWQLLVAARDPISNGEFVKQLPSLTARLVSAGEASPVVSTATLLSRDGVVVPSPPPNGRFGSFRWQSSPSADVVAEIVEFAYDDDARLILFTPVRAAAANSVSHGKLWTTRRAWQWRVWSISRTGDIAFSDARTFTH